MKRLLVVRIPISMPAERSTAIAEQIRSKVVDEFTVLVFDDKVDKIEVEIIYDPNLNADQTDQLLRQFTQVDTSTNAYMGGKP